MSHHCHATACPIEVPPTMWGCKRHWFMVPKPIRDRIWASYRVGQCDDMNPSMEYCHAAREAVIAVAELEGKESDTKLYDLFLLAKCTCQTMNEDCPPSNDRVHSYEWWDGTGPCRFCGLATCPACNPTTGEHP